jgi:hypothetical protein
MKDRLHRRKLPFYVLTASSMLFCFSSQATLLDGFPSSTRTGWTDTANGGSFFTSPNAFSIGTANANGSLTYSLKTSQALTTLATHTLELSVDVKSVRPAGNDTNALAILAWVPSAGAVLSNGYSVAVGSADLQIRADSTVLFATNFTTSLQNTNITIVMRLTPSGTDVIVKARVYKKSAGTRSLLFEQSVTNASGIIGSGNAGLGVLNQASATGAGVVYDDLQAFDLTDGLVDDFSGAVPFAFWSKFSDVPAFAAIGAVESGGVVTLASPTNGAGTAIGILEGMLFGGRTFKITDGGRVEFSVDVVSNGNGDNAYAVLSYLPSATADYIGNVRGYHISNLSGPYDDTLFVGKQYNVWWSSIDDATVDFPVNNYRLIQTYSGEGTSCRIESRLEDLNVDVNDPARIRYQNVFVDTAGADGTGPNPDVFNGGSAYLNFSGFFVLEVFNGGTPIGAAATFDNARFSQTPPPNGAPFFTEVTPVDNAKFLSASTVVQFHVIDDVSTPLNNIVLTLNGVRYTNGHPNVAITPTGGTASDRLFRLTNALVANVNYVGSIQATDNVGLASLPLLLHFDTFSTSLLQIESEEYNFTSGSFIDPDVTCPNGAIVIVEQNTDTCAYNSKPGTPEIDFHDNRTGNPGYNANNTFRTEDAVRTSNTGDPARAKYTAVSGSFEQVVQDIFNGDWMNYTHAYPAGTYNIYMRESLFQLNLPQAVSTLERVTGDRTLPDQTTAPVGAFITPETGFGVYRNVPLTDAIGNLSVVRFTGAVDTLRITQRITGNYDDNVGQLAQNYFVLVPTSDPGTLRPFVSLVSPLAGSTLKSVFPVVTATIANRDTTVDTNTILLEINGVAVSPTVVSNVSGADVSYELSPLPAPGTILTNTLIFADSGAVFQTNTWTWTLTYTFLRASNSLPVGTLTERGFDYRMVQADAGGQTLGNSLIRAEQQLAIPPAIPYDRTWRTNVSLLDWTDAGAPWVPGLDDGPSGYPSGNYENIATEIFTYLELAAGPHRFHIVTDDRSQWRSGASLTDTAATILYESVANTDNSTFDFVAESTGLYPVRGIWEENGGGASFHLYSVNISTNTDEGLVNSDTSSVKAWLPAAVSLVSSASVDGPYTLDNSAVIDLTAKTITVARSGSSTFYKVQTVGTTPTKIVGVSLSGSNIILTYQFQ